MTNIPELARQNEAAFHHSMKRRRFLDRDGQSAGSLHHWSRGAWREPARITRAEYLALNALVAEICGGNAADVVYQSRLGINPD